MLFLAYLPYNASWILKISQSIAVCPVYKASVQWTCIEQPMLASSRGFHYWSFWFHSLIRWMVSKRDESQMTWSVWLVSDIICFWHYEVCLFVCVLIVSYAICTFLVSSFESTKAIAKSTSVIVSANRASKSNNL